MRGDLETIRREVHGRLIDGLSIAQEGGSTTTEIDARTIEQMIADVAPLLDAADIEVVRAGVFADLHGMGALEDYMIDPAITDVMVVGGKGVWVESNGVMAQTELSIDDAEIQRLIERVVAPLGLRIDKASPIVDARLADGTRVNAVLPPLAVDGPCLTMRRFGVRSVSVDDVASSRVAGVLRAAVRSKLNIVVSGGTGSGKTTLLNALSQLIADTERVITIEDTAELSLGIDHVVRLEARPANTEGVGSVPIRDLVRTALRMRPDRIVVGEIRGGESLDMIQAMNTGHEGSMSTCHANSTYDALRRIETMALTANSGLPLDAVRQQISSSIDLVVHMSRRRNGERYISDVSEVVDKAGIPVVRQICDGTSIVQTPTRLSRLPS